MSISLSVVLAAAMCALAACESTSIAGPSGRRARMVDEQLQDVLEDDFPVGASRAAVRAKAEELGMVALGTTAAQDPEDASEEDVFTFSFDPESSWGITRTVRVRYGPTGRVERTTLDPRAGAHLEPEPVGGWIRVEGGR